MPPFVACTIYFSYFKVTLLKLYRSIFCPKDEILILFHTVAVKTKFVGPKGGLTRRTPLYMNTRSSNCHSFNIHVDMLIVSFMFLYFNCPNNDILWPWYDLLPDNMSLLVGESECSGCFWIDLFHLPLDWFHRLSWWHRMKEQDDRCTSNNWSRNKGVYTFIFSSSTGKALRLSRGRSTEDMMWWWIPSLSHVNWRMSIYLPVYRLIQRLVTK